MELIISVLSLFIGKGGEGGGEDFGGSQLFSGETGGGGQLVSANRVSKGD